MQGIESLDLMKEGDPAPAVVYTQFLVGHGDPVPSLGIVGDSYFDLTTNAFWGPKTADGWGSEPSGFLKGATGETGAIGPSGAPGAIGADGKPGEPGPLGPQGEPGVSGNTVLNGEGSPSSDLGIPGDFYIDLTGVTIYGPKTENGWPESGISLVGQQGPAGPQGPKGDPGVPGILVNPPLFVSAIKGTSNNSTSKGATIRWTGSPGGAAAAPVKYDVWAISVNNNGYIVTAKIGEGTGSYFYWTGNPGLTLFNTGANPTPLLPQIQCDEPKPVKYYFTVTAIDNNGRSSGPSNPAGEIEVVAVSLHS
jgi:hypothetical protein